MMPSFHLIVGALICCFLLGASLIGADVPPRVQIGGFFAPVSSNGNLIVDQAEHIAAFIMAANEINNKADGIHDDLLLSTKFEIAVATEDSVTSAAVAAVEFGNAFGGSGVIAAITALHNEDALIVTKLLSAMNTLSVLTVADSSQFFDIYAYPNVVDVRPLISRQGMVLQNFICNHARKIVIFAGTDVDSIQTMTAFQQESASSCALDILAVVSVRSQLTDLSFEIDQAMSAGARYFVLFMPAEQNAWLIEQGYEAGLFHTDTVLYTTIDGAANITHYFSPETDTARVMTGFFYFEYIPDYYVSGTGEAMRFTERWRQQPSRAGNIVNGVMTCDTSLDDNGHYLYQVTVDDTAICSGLDFSSYDASGYSIRPSTALTYDATILTARAMDMAIQNNLDYTDPAVLMSLMVSNISFHGVSGPLDLFKGYPQFANDGRGIRNKGTQYAVLNFNPSLYRNGSMDFMVRIGTFDGDTKQYTPCAPADNVNCFLPMFSGQTEGSYHIPPLDSPPIIYATQSLSFDALCFALAGIILALVLLLAVLMVYHRRSKVLKASQPILLWCILIGGVISAARILMGGLPKTDITCTGEIWFGHLAFTVMVGSLFVKSYRVHRIVNTKKLARVTFSAMKAFRILLGIVASVVIYLGIAQQLGRPEVLYQRSFVNNQETDIAYCDTKRPHFETALFTFEAIFLAFSFRVCWKIRNVPDIVNESKQISTAMSAIVLVSVLILPIIFLLGLPHHTAELIASFGFGFGAIVTLTLVFIPKMSAHYNWDGAKHSAKVAMEAMLSAKSKRRPSQVAPTAAEGMIDMLLDQDVEHLLKGKTNQEKLLACQEQMRRWQAVLMHHQRLALNSTNSNVRASSDGVQSFPVKIEPPMISVAEADPELNCMPVDLNVYSEPFLSVEQYQATRQDISGTLSSTNTGPHRYGELLIQDVC
jgi:hypothetical protein